MKLLVLAGFSALAFVRGPASPTFHSDIAPIIYAQCAPCHRPGEAGPFSLLTYEDVKKHARQIQAVTRSRFMPPWLPAPGYGEFLDERRLTTQQIRIISNWVDAGTPEGPKDAAAPVPTFTEGWQLGPPDLILKATHPKSLSASGTDVFWNFVLQPQINATRYVRAIEIRPGDKRVVHHANVIVDRTGSTKKLELADSDGFEGMDLTTERSVFDPDSHFLFWKPGAAPSVEPDGLAWRLDPGNELILNTHLQPTGKREEVQPTIGLYFTNHPQTLFPVLIQLEHDEALNIPAGVRDFEVRDDFRLPADVDVLAIYPHAHYLGKRLESYVTLPNGQREWLIRILDWDLNWQGVYRYRKPVYLPKDTVISMRYWYDNSAANPRNPNHPPQAVAAGNRATDEMGHLWIQVLPRGQGDRRRVIEQALMAHKIEKNPSNFLAHLNLGALMLSRLQTQQAVAVLAAAVGLKPEHSQAHNLLGASLMQVGRTPEAIEQFKLALEREPGNVNARYNLAAALLKAGRLPEAADHLTQVVAAFPRDARARNVLGEILFEEGKYVDALAQFNEALRLDPAYEDARHNRQFTLERSAAH